MAAAAPVAAVCLAGLAVWMQEGGPVLAQFIILSVFPALLIAAAAWDIATFTIPNFLQLALIATFLVLAAATGMPLAMFGMHVLAGAVALVIAFTLFALGYIGGGDAKLFACTALLFGASDAVAYGLIATVYGGLLTLVLLSARRHPLPGFLAMPWLVRLHDEGEGVPYGVALAAGAATLLPHAEIFRLAAG